MVIVFYVCFLNCLCVSASFCAHDGLVYGSSLIIPVANEALRRSSYALYQQGVIVYLQLTIQSSCSQPYPCVITRVLIASKRLPGPLDNLRVSLKWGYKDRDGHLHQTDEHSTL